jgi:hypothetical protein
MVPLSALVAMDTYHGPEFTMRFNEYRSSQLLVGAATGYSSGEAMKALEEVFAQTMPAGMGFDYMGMSFQEKVASEGVPASVIFGFSLLFVFLILAAQYESWALPFSVLLVTPIAVFGAFGALWLLKLVAPQASENDVFTQIGLVMLIGLSAKNAILIVEFAKVEFEGGKSIRDAALAAAQVRLRPILMTAFAFILGVVPLVLATGAGAHGRVLLGLAVFGGMLAASVIAIFLIPVSFYLWRTSCIAAHLTRNRRPARLFQGRRRDRATGTRHSLFRSRLCRRPTHVRAEVTEEGTEDGFGARGAKSAGKARKPRQGGMGCSPLYNGGVHGCGIFARRLYDGPRLHPSRHCESRRLASDPCHRRIHCEYALVGVIERCGTAETDSNVIARKPGPADRYCKHPRISGSAHDRQVRSGSLVRLQS